MQTLQVCCYANPKQKGNCVSESADHRHELCSCSIRQRAAVVVYAPETEILRSIKMPWSFQNEKELGCAFAAELPLNQPTRRVMKPARLTAWAETWWTRSRNWAASRRRSLLRYSNTSSTSVMFKHSDQVTHLQCVSETKWDWVRLSETGWVWLSLGKTG